MNRDVANPYEPPRADLEVPTTTSAEPGGTLASRGQRLLGAFLDGALGFAMIVPAMRALDGRETAHDDHVSMYTTTGTSGYVSLGLMLALMALQSYLITLRGQSLGKMIVGTRIVRLDGSHPRFVHGVLLRTWLTWAIGYLPGIGFVNGVAVSIVEVLFIFGRDRRCGHDLIAGTKVIKVVK